MILTIHPDNPDQRKINQAVEVLKNGGVIIYPTDSVYALACDIEQHKAVDDLCRLRRIDPTKANLTFICQDIKMVAQFAHQIDNEYFKVLKANSPGPITFIFKAGKDVPKSFKNKKKTIGVRIPEHPISQAIVETLGRPIFSTTLKDIDNEFFVDPMDIKELYEKRVDLIIDGGLGGDTPSTILDCTGDEPIVIRDGEETLV
ncbi:MAG: threonylcarbamoyl-AMP synthase [Saprospiraceae bacterium]|nr:threonylcarbamoyl-AMP synthase [Saprospiraceae bacterium]